MSREFWQLSEVTFDDKALRVKIRELVEDNLVSAESIEIADATVRGKPLGVTSASRQITVTFENVIEFRVVPEITSWPLPDDAETMSTFLFRMPGQYYYGAVHENKDETFDQAVGWIDPRRAHCYIIHSESFDLHVLSRIGPRVS